MKIAVEYTRMSTDMQEHSISSQERMIHDYAKRNDINIIRKYSDEGISGQLASKRPDFLKMIDDSESGDFQYVLIYDSSRFARNLVESLKYKKILKDNGVQLISITEPIIEDDEMSLYFDAFSGASNEIFVRKLSKNVKRGHIEKCIRGELCGSPSYGYYKDRMYDTYQIKEDEAEIIRYIFKCTLDDIPYNVIANNLFKQGIKTKRGNTFDSRHIKRMLQNPAYKGYLHKTIDGQTFHKKADIEPIVDEETFDKAQEIIKEREYKYKKNSKPIVVMQHWLSSLLICTGCNSKFTYYHYAAGNRSPRFRCFKGSKGACNLRASIRVDTAEKMVLDILQEIYSSQSLEPYISNIRIPALESKIDYNREITKLNLQLKRAKEAYLAEIDTLEEYKENKNRISNELSKMKKEQTASKKPVKINQDNFKSKLYNVSLLLKDDSVPLQDKIKASHSIIEKIYANPIAKTMDIYFFA